MYNYCWKQSKSIASIIANKILNLSYKHFSNTLTTSLYIELCSICILSVQCSPIYIALAFYHYILLFYPQCRVWMGFIYFVFSVTFLYVLSFCFSKIISYCCICPLNAYKMKTIMTDVTRKKCLNKVIKSKKHYWSYLTSSDIGR